MFNGAAVRDLTGTTGRILSWDASKVVIGWEDGGKLLPREEAVSGLDKRLQQLEMHTLDAGWVPLGHFFSQDQVTPMSTPSTTIQQLRKLIGEADETPIAEASKHYPFKNKAHLGPGPREGENDKASKWTCSCSGYNCTCTSKDGQKKKVFIDKGYKKAYNKEYKAWRAKQGGG